MFNFAFAQAFPKKKYRENLYGEKVEVKETPPSTPINEIEVKDAEEILSTKEFNEELDKIESIIDDENSDEEEDEEWEELDLNKDGVIDKEEIEIAKQRVEDLKDILENKSISGWRRNKIMNEIERIENLLPEDDLTITY